MSKPEKNKNLGYSARFILNGVHRSDTSARADIKILNNSIEEVKYEHEENVVYALEFLSDYFEEESKSNISKRDAEIFAHYVKERFSS